MTGLEKKVEAMYGKQFDIRDKLKPIERRLKVLDEHIKQTKIYTQYYNIYRKYIQQKPKNKELFIQSHRREIILYEAASRYLKKVMNGKSTLPIKRWNMEREQLEVKRKALNLKYTVLRSEVKEVEQIRRNVHDLMREEIHIVKSTPMQGIESID